MRSIISCADICWHLQATNKGILEWWNVGM